MILLSAFFKSLLFSGGQQQMQGREAVADSLNERARADRVGGSV